MSAEQHTGGGVNSIAGHLAHTSFARQNVRRRPTHGSRQSRGCRKPDQQRFFLTYLDLTKLQAHLTKLGLDDLGGKLV
jgi:hypothetical protein